MTTMRAGDTVEVFIRDIDWRRGTNEPRWERAVFEEFAPSGFVRVKMTNGSMRLFDVSDIREAR